MTVYTLIRDEARKTPLRRPRRNGLLQLGWLHYWMLAGILGGMLALVAMVFLVQILRP